MKTSVRWKNNLQEMVLLISSKLESWILSRLPHLIYVNYTKNITMLRKHLFTPWINFGMMLKSNQNHHSELLSNCKSLKLLSPSSWKFSWKRQNQTEHNCRNSYLLNNIFNHMRLFFPSLPYRNGTDNHSMGKNRIKIEHIGNFCYMSINGICFKINTE